jgi:hypothetical protein
MSAGGWLECLTSAKVAGPSLSTFTTAVTAIPSPARHTIPADEWDEGDQILIMAAGRVSNVITTQPTFTFQFMLGTVATPIIAATTGAVLTSATAHTTVPWTLFWQMTVRAIGSGTAGNLMHQATASSRAFVDAGTGGDVTTTGHPSLLAPETTPAVGTGFDTNIANVADFFIACSASAAGNLIQVEQYALYKTVRL